MTSRYRIFEEDHLSKMKRNWCENNWDLERSIDWQHGIDFSKPLVSLDQHAFLFPGASKEERLAISQMMGLLIAASIFEMEESLLRIKNECFLAPFERYPLSPEFLELGEQFFCEEVKHSNAFRRYFNLFCQGLDVEPQDFLAILPKVHHSKSEAILKFHAKQGGHSFWWIVAIVEQEFLSIYRNLKSNVQTLDPLYYRLHQLHFEEEVRHAPFPMMMLEFLHTTETKPLHFLWKNYDLVAAQVLQGAWTVLSLNKMKQIKKLQGKSAFFDIIINILPQLEQKNTLKLIYQLFTQTPYVSTLVNPEGSAKILKFARENGKYSLPFPELETNKIVGY